MQDVIWNYSVDVCFFDQEEAGSVGAEYYVRQFVVPKRHLAMINLDVEGTGEEVYVGPTGVNTRMIMRYVREAELKTGFPMVERMEYPGSDHLPFLKLGLEDISISVVPKGDGDRLTNWVRNGYKTDPTKLPNVLGVMHTVDDRSNLVTLRALKISYEFTRTLLLLLNESKR
jgi:Zn-dependent M28 family amino/carboxypeptidase